jgi:hypothetical protein
MSQEYNSQRKSVLLTKGVQKTRSHEVAEQVSLYPGSTVLLPSNLYSTAQIAGVCNYEYI